MMSKLALTAKPSVHGTASGDVLSMIHFKARIRVLYPRANETYACTVYGSADAQDLAAYNNMFQFDKPEADVVFDYGVPARLAKLPYFLHMDLFSTSTDPEMNFPATLRMAHAQVSFDRLNYKRNASSSDKLQSSKQQGIQINFVDIDGVVQATLAFEPSLDLGSKIAPRVHAFDAKRETFDSDGYGASLIDAVTHAYDRLAGVQSNRNERFSYYMSYQGASPILAFVYGTTRQRHDAVRVEALLLHLMQLGGAMLGFAMDDFISDGEKELSDADKGDWLAEMCTIYFRGLLYCHDMTRASTLNKTKETDEWSNMGAWPADGRTGYDCEDGAHWVLELLYLLRHATLSHPALLAMRRFYSHYLAFFTLGELHSRNADGSTAFVAHAFVTLLDRDYVTGVRLTELKPCIVIEATTYTQGAWDAQRMKSITHAETAENEYLSGEQLFNEAMLTVSGKNDIRKFRRVCKARVPAVLVKSGGMYGNIWALVCPDFGHSLHDSASSSASASSDPNAASPAAVHYIVHTASHAHALCDDLFMYAPTVMLTEAVRVSGHADLAKLSALVRECPLSKLPNVPAADKRSYPIFKLDEKSARRYVIRAHEAKLFVKAIGSLLKTQKRVLSAATLVYITDKVAVAIVDSYERE